MHGRVRPGARVAEQIKAAGREVSCGTRAPEDEEMRSATGASRARLVVDPLI
jgi:hypothetical protein